MTTVERRPEGSTTTSDGEALSSGLEGAIASRGVPRLGRSETQHCRRNRRRHVARVLDFLRPQYLAMRAVAADLGARQQDLKSEMGLNLSPQPLQRVAEKLLDLPAAQADHVRVLLLGARLVVVLIPA